MKRLLKIVALLFFALLALWFLAPVGRGQEKAQKAGDKFKNIKVLKEMPADQLGKAMNMMSASLGVDCKFCHTSSASDFELDGNEHKDIAREMIAMTFELNKRYFEGRPVINCNTCHNGLPMPKGEFPLVPSTRPPRLRQPAVKPDVSVILTRYLNVCGGPAVLRTQSRVITARRAEPDGKTFENETILQSRDRLRIDTSYGDLVVSEVFDGSDAWKSAGAAPVKLNRDEVDDIVREARIFAQPDLRRTFASFEYRSLERIGADEADVILAKDSMGTETLLYFNRRSGLLVRRRGAVPTLFGDFVSQMDYSDYKSFGGVMVPTTLTFAVPGIYWTRKISDIRTNVPIEDSRFIR